MLIAQCPIYVERCRRRPPTVRSIRALVLRLARENPSSDTAEFHGVLAAQRLAGRSVSAIAATLNVNRVPNPSLPITLATVIGPATDGD